MVIHAPLPLVKEVAARLTHARVTSWREGAVWVQSPDFERLDGEILEEIISGLRKSGVVAEVLEDQDPFPPECDEGV